jgi:rare lipoprotein A
VRRGARIAISVLLVAGISGCATGAAMPRASAGRREVADRPPAARRSDVGLASWYGEPHHGQPTASGEIFDMAQLTAAHRTLPLGTRLRIVNLENGRTVGVRVNDRGPYVPGRIIDLSRGAAAALGMVEQGIVPVKLEVVEDRQ